MLQASKMALRHPWRCLAVASILLASLFFLAAGLAPADEAAAVYLVTEEGYLSLESQTVQAAWEAGYSITANGDDVRLTAGEQVELVYGEERRTVTAQEDETVKALLDQEGLTAGPLDMIAVDRSGGRTEVTVASELIFYEKETQVLPFQETRIGDPFQEVGTEVLVQQGQDGLRTNVYETICHEGAVSSRQLVDVLDQPAQDAILRVGVGQDALVAEIAASGTGGVLVLEDGTEIPYREAMAVRATAYSAAEPGVSGWTSRGTRAKVGTVAVDPRVIPYGTRMFIVSNDGKYVYGFGVAEDCGGAIKNDIIDLYFNTVQECYEFGRRGCTAYILAD